VVGFLEHPLIAEFSSKITRLPLTDYIELQKLIASCDINIAPLQSNLFTECKSELKFFEAAAVETVTVASRTGSLAAAIADGVDGELASDHEWRSKLRGLIDNPGRLAMMASKARETALQKFSPSAHAKVLQQL
jgi:glycosyltransferase involved in cell wall biosynthesis